MIGRAVAETWSTGILYGVNELVFGFPACIIRHVYAIMETFSECSVCVHFCMHILMFLIEKVFHVKCTLLRNVKYLGSSERKLCRKQCLFPGEVVDNTPFQKCTKSNNSK